MSALPMPADAAALYEGRVEHVRLDPVVRRFRYRIAMAWLDLDRLDEAFSASRWASRTGLAPLRWRRSDHFGDPGTPLAESVRAHLERATGRAPRGPVRLLTQLRNAGYGFNPASFFYCYEGDDRGLAGVLVEVTNTPWGERHLYWVDGSDRGDPEEVARSLPKEFHVSPFMGMDADYAFRFAAPDDLLHLAIDCRRGGAPFFYARLDLARRPWCARELRRHALRHFARPARLHAAIHWQALRLLAAGVRFHPHPGRATGADVSGEASAS